jgi:cobalt-zinc-cadmium resistance protein CzcA
LRRPSALIAKLAAFPGINFNHTQPAQDAVDEAETGLKSSLAVKIFGANLMTLEQKGKAITVLGVVLTAPVGGIFALWITGTPFSVSSGIGFLALFGVSVQTAIVYISYVNELRGSGTPLAEAIRLSAILRLRPIMMTALVAALGLLPVALATGVGTDSQRPFALVIVSGLFTRLLISIFLMPVLYTLVARPEDRLEV